MRQLLLASSLSSLVLAQSGPATVQRWPAQGATRVNPDTHIVLTFPAPPAVGTSGQIRVYDSATRALVDTLDLAVPPKEQLAVIGGFTEGFHFYPVLVRDRTATITLHPHVLTYGKRYEIEIDPGAIVADGFQGIGAANRWTFTTRAAPPPARQRVVVAADGTGDFNTLQGAIDAVPDSPAGRVTIFIRRGRYEEIVYLRHKANLTFEGEDRAGVVIGYANNELFNGPPTGVPTNEKPGTFPYRRAAFAVDRSTAIHVTNLTIANFTPRGGSQAEALLLSGGQHIVSRVTLTGHQDTLQVNDAAYIEDSDIEGDTDFLWGRGPAYFTRTTLRQLSATSPFMWVRSTSASHGFVFVGCRFETPAVASGAPLLARNTANYPNSEVVLIDSRIGAIDPAAWSLAGDTSQQHYWEFNSRNLDGTPVDVTRRHPASRQLDAIRDAATITQYRDPAWVLGWKPQRR